MVQVTSIQVLGQVNAENYEEAEKLFSDEMKVLSLLTYVFSHAEYDDEEGNTYFFIGHFVMKSLWANAK